MAIHRALSSKDTIGFEQISELTPAPMRIWIVNPFDQLPNETDVPLRYWALCRTFATLGHQVIWWSSDFSHLTKSKRKPCPDTDGFSIRLIDTPPYTKNISFARLKNHRQFAQGFFHEAMSALKSGQLLPPDRIVVSLPPLGVAEQAFRIRDWLNRSVQLQQPNQDSKHSVSQNEAPSSHSPLPTLNSAAKPLHTLHSSMISPCEVILDIMDAWPETFYQALPKSLRKALGPRLLAPMHRSARRAYQGADKISAVGQSYLDLAETYLHSPSAIRHPPLQATCAGVAGQSPKPMHLCYHGTDLERFQRSKCMEQNRSDALQPSNTTAETKETTATTKKTTAKAHRSVGPQTTPIQLDDHGSDAERAVESAERKTEDGELGAENRSQQSKVSLSTEKEAQHVRQHARRSLGKGGSEATIHSVEDRSQTPHVPLPTPNSAAKPLQAIYLGAMGTGYDLETIILVAAKWKAEGRFPVQIHLVGDGPQLEKLKTLAQANALTTPTPPQSYAPKPQSPQTSNFKLPRVVFHGYLQKDAIAERFAAADLALVANRPQSLVACPYKAGEYAAAALPMISCLAGELGQLLTEWDAGSEYKEGDVDSLHAAFENYLSDSNRLASQSLHARQMAEAHFDRSASYPRLVEFMTDPTRLVEFITDPTRLS
ncbi:glycosyltransferase [Coraliomargarita algicola]|uniref:Glycosyltransferase n=1 Tax=Coraliomargarita algicola TaxID=3092156 RepID=A0ABZ0RIF2_9BACT|nr:glycosyltransferase [Coraliomargarita sp. J2-16]WPJ95019.1 glycosyltransferase [Coraliomargarita sp. J2-16]